MSTARWRSPLRKDSLPYPSPVRDSPTIKYQLWRYYLKETLEVGVGRIVGYGRLSRWTTGH